jgi:phage major head subunit gpT-like protein
MPGPAIHSTINPNQLTIKDFDKIYYDSYLRPSPEYTEFANVLTGKANYYRAGQIGGFGSIPDMDEGDAIAATSFKQGNEKTIKYMNIGIQVQVTQNMREDDNSGLIAKIPQMLGKSMLYTCELKGADLLNAGFVTTTRAGLDGVALFSSSHVLVDSGSGYDNLGTTGSLSETTLLELMDLMERTVTENGIPAPIQPKLLIVPVDLRWVAERLLLSELRPGTMDNDTNVLKGKLRFMVNHYLTSTTAYFLLADKSGHDLQFVWRRKQQTQAQDDFNTGSWMYKITARMTADFFDYRGVAANAGA